MTPGRRLTDEEILEALRRLFEANDIPETVRVPADLMAEFTARLRDQADGAKARAETSRRRSVASVEQARRRKHLRREAEQRTGP